MVTAESTALRVPSEADFEGDDFLADEALTELFADVVDSYDRLRAVIAEHEIDVPVLWKRRGGMSGGVPVYGSCVKTGGLLKHFCGRPFAIWLAADHIADAKWTTDQIRRALYHEARFIGWQEPNDVAEDGPGRPIKVRPELMLFDGEVSDTGTWDMFRHRVGAEFRQPNLFVENE